MYWFDPEVVLPEEGKVVVCQALEHNGLVKGMVRKGVWVDMNRMPLDVVKWKEIDTANGTDTNSKEPR